MPLVPETKMADLSKLISLGNLLVRKVTWLMLTTMSATLILSRAFGADCMTRRYIYIHTHTHTLSLSQNLFFFIVTYRDSIHTLSLLHFDLQQSTTRKCIYSTTILF